MSPQHTRKSIILGAAFLMATSAIGPGFLTQTTVFTAQLFASFGFVILVSILLDMGAQLNIWRIIAVTERRAQDIANELLPGLGHLLAMLIVLGGLAFNIGNIAGCGLGLNVLLGMKVEYAALLSGLLAVGIFLVKEATVMMDRFAKLLGFLMIGLTLYVAFTSSPPLAQAALKTIAPDHVDITAIITLVGGTVGGYITFAGAHRLCDAGIKGTTALPEVSRGAVSAIGLASLMRILLFLASLGVIVHGFQVDPANPPASVFRQAAGSIGYKLFGIVMWSAAITSVVGSAYTSVSFIRSLHPLIDQYYKNIIMAFIVLSTFTFVCIGQPVKTLLLVGTLNGFILPVSLSVMLIAAYKKKIIGDYRHPLWLTCFGAIVVLLMTWMSIQTMISNWNQFF